MKKIMLNIYNKWKSINKERLNQILTLLIAFISLLFSILAYSSSITGNIKIKIEPNGDIINIFEEDLYTELNDIEIESHRLTDITSGVQQISICLMNTSSNPVYITQFDIDAKIGSQDVVVNYKIDKEKTKANYETYDSVYEQILHDVDVDYFDDKIEIISINPGEFCIIFLDLKIVYPDNLLDKVYSEIYKKYPQLKDNKIINTQGNKPVVYNIFDATLYNTLYSEENNPKSTTIFVKYCLNGSKSEKIKKETIYISPAFAYEGVIIPNENDIAHLTNENNDDFQDEETNE